MGCTDLSSCCFTEIEVPIDLRWVSQGISGLLLMMSSHLLYVMWNARWLWIQWRGNVRRLELIWGTPIFFAFLRWHQCSSPVLTVFLGILFSSFWEIEVPFVFDLEHGTPQHERHWNRASSCGQREVSWFFSSCGTHMVYILELRGGWPCETRVCSEKSGLLTGYDGHLRKLNYAWQENTDASGG